jgi:hypothetical protein
LKEADDGEKSAANSRRNAQDASHDVQAKVAEVSSAHASLESQQALLDKRQDALENLQASQQASAGQSAAQFAVDLQSARDAWSRQLAAAQQSLDAVLQEVGARRSQDAVGSAPSASAVECVATATAAVRMSEEKVIGELSIVKEQQEIAQRKLEDFLELRTSELDERLRICIAGQQEQESKLGRVESDNVVAYEQMRQDLAQRLASIRSQIWEERGAAEARLQSCSAAQDELVCQNKALTSKQEVAEKHYLAEHRHLSAELGNSETRLLCEQRAVLMQVNDFVKAQEVRMVRHSTKSNAKHEETADAMQEMHEEVMGTTQQLIEDFFREQASEVASLRLDLREAESASISEGTAAKEAAVQVLSDRMRAEFVAAQSLCQNLAEAQESKLESKLEELQVQCREVKRQGEELASRSESEAASALALEARDIAEKHASLKVFLASEIRAAEEQHASLKQELHSFEHSVQEAEASSRSENVQRVAMECAAVQRQLFVEQRAAADKARLAEEALRSDMKADARAFRGEMNAEVQSFLGEVKADMQSIREDSQADTQAVCGEMHAAVQAMRGDTQAIRENVQADTQAVCGEMHAAVQAMRGDTQAELRVACGGVEAHVGAVHGKVDRVREELQSDVQFMRSELQADMQAACEVVWDDFKATSGDARAETRTGMEALRADARIDARAIHAEVMEELLATREEVIATKASWQTSRDCLHSEFAEKYCDLGHTMSRLESSTSASAIAAAAASAALDVRKEVLEMVSDLHGRLESFDEQLLFIRGEVAPDVLRGVLRRDLANSMEQTAAEQLARFRKRWGGDVERKLDCVVQCLRSLYLKVGLPPHGALSLLPTMSHPVEFENLT